MLPALKVLLPAAPDRPRPRPDMQLRSGNNFVTEVPQCKAEHRSD